MHCVDIAMTVHRAARDMDLPRHGRQKRQPVLITALAVH
jgi:hypothetical protein